METIKKIVGYLNDAHIDDKTGMVAPPFCLVLSAAVKNSF